MALTSSSAKRLASALAGATLAVAVFVAIRIARYPENHVGWDPRWAAPIPFASALLGVVAWRRGERKQAVVVAFALVVLGLLFAVVSLNWLVPYELWLSRGMPERPF